jgi:hypothetical protein
MNFLVIPTIRQKNIENFLESWKENKDWDRIVLVEDNPEISFNVEVDYHFSWKEIDEDLKENSWIISRQDSAIRSFGFYKAWELGATNIFTLDDDCLPIEGVPFCQEHIKNLNTTTKWCESVLGFRTRGIPYENFGNLNNVKFSMGLWEGVPDFDAIHMLSNCIKDLNLTETRVMPQGQYFPFCGMNFAFTRDVTPLAYFPLMGKNSPFGRFDDIWFGIICKKICDHLNYSITCGKPYIYHSKASNAFNNLIKEAPGIKFNEFFWEFIDKISLKEKTPILCMKEIGENLETNENNYLNKLGKAIKIWSNLFNN